MTYEEFLDNTPMKYEDRDPYKGLVEDLDFPKTTLQSSYMKEVWGQQQELGKTLQ